MFGSAARCTIGPFRELHLARPPFPTSVPGQPRTGQTNSETLMTVGYASTSDTIPDRAPAWGPVLAMALCCMVLVASEFMPVILLTPIASDRNMTEGQAGQLSATPALDAL
jgi:hypothetical protein